MGKLREIYGMRRKVSELKVLIEPGEPFVLTFGSAHEAKLIVLPASWAPRMSEIYQPGRVLRVNHRSLKESVVLDILTNQVDEHLKPWTYGELEVGAEVVPLVPASPFWLKMAVTFENGR